MSATATCGNVSGSFCVIHRGTTLAPVCAIFVALLLKITGDLPAKAAKGFPPQTFFPPAGRIRVPSRARCNFRRRAEGAIGAGRSFRQGVEFSRTRRVATRGNSPLNCPVIFRRCICTARFFHKSHSSEMHILDLPRRAATRELRRRVDITSVFLREKFFPPQL